MEKTCTFTSPARDVIELPLQTCIVIWDPRHDLGELSVVNHDEHVHCEEQVKHQSQNRGMKAGFCVHRLILSKQFVTIRLRQPDMCQAPTLCYDYVALGISLILFEAGVGVCPNLPVDIGHHRNIGCCNHNLVLCQHLRPVMECQRHCFQLQTIDMELELALDGKNQFDSPRSTVVRA